MLKEVSTNTEIQTWLEKAWQSLWCHLGRTCEKSCCWPLCSARALSWGSWKNCGTCEALRSLSNLRNQWLNSCLRGNMLPTVVVSLAPSTDKDFYCGSWQRKRSQGSAPFDATGSEFRAKITRCLHASLFTCILDILHINDFIFLP